MRLPTSWRRRATALLGVVCLLALPQAAAAAGKVAFVVQPGPPGSAAALAAHLARPLQQRGLSLLPGARYRSAARAEHVDAAHLLDPDAVILAAHRAKVRWVLVVAPSADRDLRSSRRRPRWIYATRVVLLAGDTGEELFNRRYPQPQRTLQRSQGRLILRDLLPLLGGAALPAARRRIALSAPPLEPLPPAYLPEAQFEAGELDPRQAHIPFGSRNVPEAALPRLTEMAADAAPPAAKLDLSRHRTPLRLTLSPSAYVRRGQVKSRPGLTPPSYGPRRGVAAPVFFRIDLRVELYPFAFYPADSWVEGFGGHLQLGVGSVRTKVRQPRLDDVLVTSVVGGGGGGLHYRFVGWHSKHAPDLLLKLGGARYWFPLTQLQFPSLGYVSPYVGGSLEVPIVAGLQAFADFTYQFRLIGEAGAHRLGVQVAPGTGSEGLAGLRLTVLENLQLSAAYQRVAYRLPFVGLTGLDGPLQYANVQLQDVYQALMLGIGFAL